MAIPTITNGQLHCFPFTYEGNGLGQRVGKFVPFTNNGTISKSCLFNDDDTPRLYRQISGGNRKTYTISLWFKLGKSPSTDGAAFWATSPSNDSGYGGNPSPYNMQFFQFVSGALEIQDYNTSGNHYIFRKRTNRTFEDTSKWYHLLMAVDTTESTASDRVKLYIDGDLITSFNDVNGTFGYPDLNEDTTANQNTYYDVINIGYNQHWDGYMAEFNFVDGTALTPSTFGLTDTSTGRWIPKTLTGITYGTNGYRLTFANNAGQTIGDDTSGNTNDFTVTNLDANDITTDTPTKLFPTLDPTSTTSLVLSEGNTRAVANATGVKFHFTRMAFDPSDSTGYYMEFLFNQGTGAVAGFRLRDNTFTSSQGYQTDKYVSYNSVDDWRVDNTVTYAGSNVSPTYIANGTIIGVYIKENKVYYSFNGVMQNSSNPVAVFKTPGRYMITVGHNSNYTPYADVTIRCRQDQWSYTPSGAFANFREICQPNLSEESNRGIPDFTFIKDFDQAVNWHSYDSSRGAGYYMLPSTSGAETYAADTLQQWLKGGFEVEDDTSINKKSSSTVAWNWVANNGVTGANTDGSGSALSCNYQTNEDAGFSIVTFQGNSGQTAVEHGLSQAPEFIIQRRRDNGGSAWYVYTTKYSIGGYHTNQLQTNIAWSTQSNGAAPTNKVFTSHGWGSDNIIAYCWYGVPGYSYFGSYLGDATTDGPFIHLDFKPAIVWLKSNNTASWYCYDSARSPKNPVDEKLHINATTTQNTNSNRGIDFCSNGFKVRQESGYGYNYSNVDTFVAAWAENPFLGSGSKSPVTAR